jgi:SAM-dependent methyltransferase
VTDPAFYSRRSLHVESYDALYPEIPGGDDIAFFRHLATETGGPVLELGCGSGRVTIPIAEAGFRTVGLDRSAPMLDLARARRRSLPSDVAERLELVEGDMTSLDLHRRFGLVFAAFRVFMALLDRDAQRSALAGIRRHLRPGGLVAIDLFDPRLEYLAPGDQAGFTRRETVVLSTGNRVVAEALTRHNDPVRQVFSELWRFTEATPDGTLIREEREELQLRWTYRHEMRNLLELAGFDVVAEYSDYAGSGPAYGGEQVWVARRPASKRRALAGR